MGFSDLDKVKADNKPLVDLVIEAKLATSKREAREFISNGAITANGNKITDLNHVLTTDEAIEGKYVLLRRGKKKYALVEF